MLPLPLLAGSWDAACLGVCRSAPNTDRQPPHQSELWIRQGPLAPPAQGRKPKLEAQAYACWVRLQRRQLPVSEAAGPWDGFCVSPSQKSEAVGKPLCCEV